MGSFSAWVKVLSGVPQGSVLGPLLFLIFVNDLPAWIVNSIKMFADDIKIWRVISQAEDSDQLQQDMYKLASWSDNLWLLSFNPEKCKVMHNCTLDTHIQPSTTWRTMDRHDVLKLYRRKRI